MLEIIAIITLLLFGLLLIFAEVLFVPGTTFVGILGTIFSILGIYFTFKVFGTTIGWVTIVVNVVVLTWAIVYGLKGKAWDKFTLHQTISSTFNSEVILNLKVGDRGKTLSDLRPIGKAEINEQTVEVKTQGTFIKSGTDIRVIKLEPNNIFVETLTD